MKVGLLGNMNNNFFALARFLRDRGIDAQVLLFDNEYSHFHPSADAFDLGFQSYCHDVSWGSPLGVLGVRRTTVSCDLEDYGFLIGTGAAPAYVAKVGRTLDVFVPYGAELHRLSTYRLVSPRRLAQSVYSVALERRGIRQASVLHLALTNELYERPIRNLRGGGERWTVGLPIVYSPQYQGEAFLQARQRTQWWTAFVEVRRECDFMIFSHGRHEWRMPESDPNHKGTDRLLRGFADFCRKRPEVRASLVTLEYGSDVRHTKQLAAELGLTEKVRWFPRMARKDLMAGLSLADAACAEFTNSWIASGVIYESLVTGTPLLGHREDELYEETGGELYPMLKCRSEREISERLDEVWKDRGRAREIGAAGREWYERAVVTDAVDRYVERIVAGQGGVAGFPRRS